MARTDFDQASFEAGRRRGQAGARPNPFWIDHDHYRKGYRRARLEQLAINLVCIAGILYSAFVVVATLL